MDSIVQYEQVSSLGTMDTSPASLSSETVPPYLSAVPQDTIRSYILDQQKQEISASAVMPSLQHMPPISIPAFLDTPMDALQFPPEPPLAAYVPIDHFSLLQPSDKVDLSPDATVLSLSMQDPTSASPFGGATSAAPEAALDSDTAVGRRSRTSTSLSPQSIPSHFSSLSPPGLQHTPTLDYASAASNSSADEDLQTPPRAVIGKMLKECVLFF